jgi:hypothetical protein
MLIYCKYKSVNVGDNHRYYNAYGHSFFSIILLTLSYHQIHSDIHKIMFQSTAILNPTVLKLKKYKIGPGGGIMYKNKNDGGTS